MVCLFRPGQHRRKRATAAGSISAGSSPKVCRQILFRSAREAVRCCHNEQWELVKPFRQMNEAVISLLLQIWKPFVSFSRLAKEAGRPFSGKAVMQSCLFTGKAI